MGNIRQNVTIALALRAVFLTTTGVGASGLWIAIMADTGFSAWRSSRFSRLSYDFSGSGVRLEPLSGTSNMPDRGGGRVVTGLVVRDRFRV